MAVKKTKKIVHVLDGEEQWRYQMTKPEAFEQVAELCRSPAVARAARFYGVNLMGGIEYRLMAKFAQGQVRWAD